MQDLQLVAELGDGRLWHAVRAPNGQWTRFGDLGMAAGGPEGPWFDGACAGVGAELHQLGFPGAGPLEHTIRFADGTWQKFGNVEEATDHKGGLGSPACAGIGDELHVCAHGGENRILHVIRHADRSWGNWGDVTRQGNAGPTGPLDSDLLAVCGMGAELHVFAVERSQNPDDYGSWLIHTVRHADGKWDGWENLTNVIPVANPREPHPSIFRVAVAAVGAELQIAIIFTAGLEVLHALRRAGGGWTRWASVYREAGDLNVGVPYPGGMPFSVAVAAVNNELHLAVTTHRQPWLWHTIRDAKGKWTKFGSVAAATGRPGTDAMSGVELAGVDESAVVIPPSPTTCYPGTAGASKVVLENSTADTVLSVWRHDLSIAAPAGELIGTSNPGDITDIELPNCHFNQVVAVSHQWVDEYNATFGTDFNPDNWQTAQLVNFQKWYGTILGRKNDPVFPGYVYD
jgi:hypothetical protein